MPAATGANAASVIPSVVDGFFATVIPSGVEGPVGAAIVRCPYYQR